MLRLFLKEEGVPANARVICPGCVNGPGNQEADLCALMAFSLNDCLKNMKEGNIFGSHPKPEK